MFFFPCCSLTNQPCHFVFFNMFLLVLSFPPPPPRKKNSHDFQLFSLLSLHNLQSLFWLCLFYCHAFFNQHCRLILFFQNSLGSSFGKKKKRKKTVLILYVSYIPSSAFHSFKGSYLLTHFFIVVCLLVLKLFLLVTTVSSFTKSFQSSTFSVIQSTFSASVFTRKLLHITNFIYTLSKCIASYLLICVSCTAQLLFSTLGYFTSHSAGLFTQPDLLFIPDLLISSINIDSISSPVFLYSYEPLLVFIVLHSVSHSLHATCPCIPGTHQSLVCLLHQISFSLSISLPSPCCVTPHSSCHSSQTLPFVTVWFIVFSAVYLFPPYQFPFMHFISTNQPVSLPSAISFAHPASLLTLLSQSLLFLLLTSVSLLIHFPVIPHSGSHHRVVPFIYSPPPLTCLLSCSSLLVSTPGGLEALPFPRVCRPFTAELVSTFLCL